MDLDDILGFERIYCTGERARGGWYFDQEAILEALDELNIKLYMQLKFMTGKYRYGTHRVKKGTTHPRFHHITVDQNHSPQEASNTLWHELAHAMQAERWAERTGRDIYLQHWEDYKAVDGEWGNRYNGNKYEIEANQLAEDKQDFHLVIFAS